MPTLHKDLTAKLITRPDNPHHFMRLKRLEYQITASVDNQVIASTTSAIKLFEFGSDVYEPIIYFPKEAITENTLNLVEGKTTFCPLKGNAEYWDVTANTKQFDSAAWSYSDPLEFSRELASFVAFDKTVIEIREHHIT